MSHTAFWRLLSRCCFGGSESRSCRKAQTLFDAWTEMSKDYFSRLFTQRWFSKPRRTRFNLGRFESLEARVMLDADYLYALEPRVGIPDDGFGFALAANDTFHVVANFAPYVSPLFLENYPDYYQSRFYGEIQVHDAITGDLLRTIQNPMPYGHPYFSNYYGFNNAYVTPNAFGYSIDIQDNLILVGSPGWEGEFLLEEDDNERDTGGKAFLFDANTGALLHTFDGSFYPEGSGGRNNDGFGRSVSIDGDRIAIGAYGPGFEDADENIFDFDPGRVYVYSVSTGDLQYIIESPESDPSESLDFGSTVSLSGTKLVVTQGTFEASPTLIYDVTTGNLLHTLTTDGIRATTAGNNVAVLAAPGTVIVNATTGSNTHSISSPMLDFDGNLIVTGIVGFDDDPFQLEVRDFPSGSVLYTVPTPTNYAGAYWEFNQFPELYEDRLLVPGRLGASGLNTVFVYSLTVEPDNNSPTDIGLSNQSVPENSANETVVGTLSAIDPDSPETFTFALTGTAGGRFKIVGNQLRVANGSLLDFESNTSHQVTVQVTDSANNSYSKTFTIQITNANDAPTDLTLSPSVVAENSPNGTIVGTLTVSDIDLGESFSFSMLNSSGGRFAINGNQVIVNNSGLLNFESQAFHQVTVQVTDSAGNTYSEVLTIQLVNVNEAPTDITLTPKVVAENSPNGTVVGGLTTVDADLGDTFTYALLASAGGRFTINGTQVVVANGNLLNFESNTSHSVTVQVTDAGGLSVSKTLTINVINVNEPPTNIAINNSTVPESAIRVIHSLSDDGSMFGTETAADGDYILISEQFGVFPAIQRKVHLIHAITGNHIRTFTAPVLNPTAGAPDGRFGESFVISGNRAYIGAGSTKVGSLDEAGAVYVYDVVSGNLLYTLNSPTPTAVGFFGNTLSVSGNLLAVSATNENGGTIYLFNAVTGQSLSTITNPTPSPLEAFGQFMALSGNTLVTSSRFEDVGATDAGVAYIYEINPITSVATLTQTLLNPTPATSEFFGNAVAVNGNIVAVKDSTSVGSATNVGSVHLFNRVTGGFLRTINNPVPGATDQFGNDLVITGDLLITNSFSDIGGSNNGRAYVFRASTGELLSTILNPSPAVNDEFAFNMAFSGGRIIASARGDDTDGNNRGLVYVFNSPIGQLVGNLSVSDPDTGETYSYSLLDNAGGRFALNGNQLVIADATKLNFETATTHNVTLQVTDSALNTFSKVIPITVTQVNEAPQDISFVGTSIPELSPNGTVVSTMTTSDPDMGNTITYSLDNSAGGRFSIVGNTIVVANGGLLDFETTTSHSVTVRATDEFGAYVLESRRINITDVSDNIDFGDLPDSYGTLLASNGARHGLGSGLRLGSSVFGEPNGQPSVNASLDMGDDGVTLPPMLYPGMDATISVSASQVSRLDAFIDYDGNGSFSAAERISPAAGWLLAAGDNAFQISVPATAVSSNLGARFRVSTLGGLGPTGLAADGEVEDYRIGVAAILPDSTTLVPDPTAPGSTMMLVTGTNANDAIFIYLINGQLQAVVNGDYKTPQALPTVSRVVVYGLDGNDYIALDNLSTAPGWIDGGTGDDYIIGGGGSDQLYGRAGNDSLFGYSGDDEIYGGTGNDKLYGGTGLSYLFGESGNDILLGNGVLVGGSGNDNILADGARNLLIGGAGSDYLRGAIVNQGDIIISGSTSFDTNLTALKAIRAEWQKSAPVLTRISNLNGTTTGGLNGSLFLNATTIFADANVNTIVNYGSIDATLNDWVFKSLIDNKLLAFGIVVTI